LDGSHASLRPAAVDQATGSASWGEAVRTIATFVPLALLSSVRVLRFGSSLKIAGMAAAGDEDLEELLRVSTVDLARVVDARLAAGRWLARWPETRAVVFSTAAAGEAKVVDLAAQREGITTIDFVHGYATYGNLRTAWRSRSSISVSWTDEQAARYREMGSNQDSWGGYFPYQALPKRPSRARPRILVLLSYVQGYSPFPANRKYARRMGRAIRAMLSQVGDRADVRIRLHPMDRPEAWDEILGGDSRLQFSDEEHLAADLAGADLVVTSISSAYLEALLYDVPIYLDGRGFVVERNTIFAHVPSARWFSDGDELCRMVERFIDGLDDAGPEQALRQRCFGGSGTPRMPGDIVDALHATMNEPREHQNNTR
jgi:hypothetical protein